MSLRRDRAEDGAAAEPADLAALADGSLGSERRAALEARLAEAPELADRLAEQERAISLVRAAAATVEAPAALRARVEARRRARRLPSRRVALIGVVAAAAAVALGVGLGVRGSATSGERLHAALGPTPLAPGARGRATLTRTSAGWRVTLDATGLPRLADGRFYEAWLRNPAGILVPLGTFNEPHGVTLWAGMSPKEFTTLTVTREQADGDQASSGERVLIGTVAGAGST